MAHLMLGGSSAHRWSRCTASAVVAETLPQKDAGTAAAEGTRLHELAANDLAAALKAGSLAGSDVPIADRPAISAYVQHCYRLVASNPGAQYWIEEPVLLAGVSAKAGGTVDFAVYFPDRNHVEIVDYKSGFSLVEEEDNDQMMFYACALIESLCLPVHTIDMTIVQPNVAWAETVRTHRITNMELFEAYGRFTWAATLIETGEAEFVMGDHCKYCPAMLHCPLMKEELMKLKNAKLVDPTDETLADILEAATPVDLYLKAVKDEAFKRASNGVNVPRHKLVRGRGSRVWEDAEAVSNLAKLHGVEDEVFETELRSVAALEKQLGRTRFATFAPLVKTKEGALKLVHESEKGQAVDPKAEGDFGAVV